MFALPKNNTAELRDKKIGTAWKGLWEGLRNQEVVEGAIVVMMSITHVHFAKTVIFDNPTFEFRAKCEGGMTALKASFTWSCTSS